MILLLIVDSVVLNDTNCSEPVQDPGGVHGEPAAHLQLRGDTDEACHTGGNQRDIHPHQVQYVATVAHSGPVIYFSTPDYSLL